MPDINEINPEELLQNRKNSSEEKPIRKRKIISQSTEATMIEEIKNKLIEMGGVAVEITCEKWNDEKQNYEFIAETPLTRESSNLNIQEIYKSIGRKYGNGRYRIHFNANGIVLHTLVKDIIVPQDVKLSELEEDEWNKEEIKLDEEIEKKPEYVEIQPLKERTKQESTTAIGALVNIVKELMSQSSNYGILLNSLTQKVDRLSEELKKLQASSPLSQTTPIIQSVPNPNEQLNTMVSAINTLMQTMKDIIPKATTLNDEIIAQKVLNQLQPYIQQAKSGHSSEMEYFLKGLEMGRKGKISLPEDEEEIEEKPSLLEQAGKVFIEKVAPALGEKIAQTLTGTSGQTQLPSPEIKNQVIQIIKEGTEEQIVNLLLQSYGTEQLRQAVNLGVNTAVDYFIQMFPETKIYRNKLVNVFNLLEAKLK
jgi:hypothetical protein